MGDTPFHEGEQRIQRLTGERASALLNGRIIAARIPGAARPFLARQRLAILATKDAGGDLWATMITGSEGFVSGSEDLTQVTIRLDDEHSVLARLPLADALCPLHSVGMLFIDLETRRRLRVNGKIAARVGGVLKVTVDEAFPNCPKYIQRRSPPPVDAPAPGGTVRSGTVLNEAVIALIRRADTAFVASSHPDGRLDASHRGGQPGFIQVREGVIWIPDYPGNSMFNTLGNFALHPQAGLTLMDFEQSMQLLLTGEVSLRLDVADERHLTGGTGRWWLLRPSRWVTSPWNTDTRWSFVDASPFNP